MNTRLGTDHHQLIMPRISKDCSNTFLERSFIYAAPCEWNKLSEHIRTSNFDCFNMDAGCKCICGASRQKGTNVGNFKIELGARYDSRSVHLSFKTKIMFLSISSAKLWYNSLL